MEPNYIEVDFPRYGLCNKIITWAKAYVWSKNNQAELIVRNWTHIPIGSILRWDKSLRWYRGFFLKSKRFPGKRKFANATVITSIHEKPLGKIKYYKFEGDPLIADLPNLADFRNDILSAFDKIMKPEHKQTAEKQETPELGIHIRRGDFVKIGNSLDLSYYTNIIQQLRDKTGTQLKVTIFTDGYKQELKEVLDLPNVELFNSVNDLVDLLVMSKSKILVTTIGSSYSYWAAFLSDNIVLHHPETWVEQCRPSVINAVKYEGKYPVQDNWPKQLEENLNSLKPLIK